MAVLKEIKALAAEMTAWRHHLHAHPELSEQEYETANFVADKLASFGLEVTRLGTTGVVATLKGKTDSAGKKILLRADTDALPITEDTGLPYASQNPGVMHACGHDGHTAMLLGAAKYLAAHNDFDGSVHFLFQPAEENGEGGPAMLAAGLFDKFPSDSIYGLHNAPIAPLGIMGTREGGLLSAADGFHVTFTGIGGHASDPSKVSDIIGAVTKATAILKEQYHHHIVKGDRAVFAVTAIHTASTATNVLPDRATIAGTMRSFDGQSQSAMKAFFEKTVHECARAAGAKAEICYDRSMPVLSNAAAETKKAIKAAQDTVGALRVLKKAPRTNGTEDFSTLLKEKPGNYMVLGTGAWDCLLHPKKVHQLHSAKFDFNDKALPIGATYWVKLTQTALPMQKSAKPKF